MLLRDRAGSSDVLRGAFHAHLLLHRLDTANGASPAKPESVAVDVLRSGEPEALNSASDEEASTAISSGSRFAGTAADGVSGQQAHQLGSDGGIGLDMLRSIRKQADGACAEYLAACGSLGWDLGQTMLNPHEPRLVDYVL